MLVSTKLQCPVLRPVHNCSQIHIECAFKSIWCALERPHWMHIQGQCIFHSHLAKPTPEVVLIQFGPSNWFHKFVLDHKHEYVICYHEKSENNSVQMKDVDWIIKGQQTNVVIVQLTNSMVEAMAGTEWTVETTRTVISFRGRQIWSLNLMEWQEIVSYMRKQRRT